MKKQTQYQAARSFMDSSRIPYSVKLDKSGNPYWLVEKKVPDECPPGQGMYYFAWGMHFSPDGEFHSSWGSPPIPVPS